MMSKLITVQVVDNRLVLVAMHNLPIAPHASVNGSLYPSALGRIQCQRIPQPVVNDFLPCLLLWSLMEIAISYLFDVSIRILQFQVQHIDAKLLKNLQRTSQTTHLIIQREYYRCFIAWRYFIRCHSRFFLSLNASQQTKKKNGRQFDRFSIDSKRILYFYQTVVRFVQWTAFFHCPFLFATAIQPQPQKSFSRTTHVCSLFCLFSVAVAFLLFVLFLALLSHSITIPRICESLGVHSSSCVVWSVFVSIDFGFYFHSSGMIALNYIDIGY